MFKSTTDLKKKRNVPPSSTTKSGTKSTSELKNRKTATEGVENKNQRLKNATTQTIHCKQNEGQQSKGYSGEEGFNEYLL